MLRVFLPMLAVMIGLSAYVAASVGHHERAAQPAAGVRPPKVPQPLASPAELRERFPVVEVMPRKGILEGKGNFPCTECHDESMPPDPTERVLTDAHDEIALVHGAGRLWCTTCHHDDRNSLRSLKGEPIDFDEQFLLCGQCHFGEQRDFFYGAHGKRVNGWNEPTRQLSACTSCHDAHDPSIKPRMPWRPGDDR